MILNMLLIKEMASSGKKTEQPSEHNDTLKAYVACICHHLITIVVT